MSEEFDSIYDEGTYLKSDEFVKGKARVFTVDGYEWVDNKFAPPPKTCELQLSPDNRKFGLSRINWRRMRALLGADKDNWTGKKIVLGLEDERKAESGVAIRINTELTEQANKNGVAFEDRDWETPSFVAS